MNLVEKIKATAKSRSITIKDLSIKAGIGPKTISNWANHNPQTETLKKVAKELGVSVDYLLGNEDEKVVTPSSDEIQDIDALGGLFRKYGERKENLSPSEAKKYQQDLVNYAEYRAEQIRKAREKKNRES